MTMHLIQGINSLNTKKRKPKMTKGNLKRWAQEMQQFNKKRKQCGDDPITLDQYIDYVHGKGLPKKRKVEFEEYKPTPNPLHSTTDHIPSHSAPMSVGSCSKVESKKYTGNFVIGIATMHKSNAVPVTNPKYAEEISKMGK